MFDWWVYLRFAKKTELAGFNAKGQRSLGDSQVSADLTWGLVIHWNKDGRSRSNSNLCQDLSLPVSKNTALLIGIWLFHLVLLPVSDVISIKDAAQMCSLNQAGDGRFHWAEKGQREWQRHRTTAVNFPLCALKKQSFKVFSIQSSFLHVPCDLSWRWDGLEHQYLEITQPLMPNIFMSWDVSE